MHFYYSLDLTPNFSNRLCSKYNILFFWKSGTIFLQHNNQRMDKVWFQISLPWYQNLLTRKNFQSWTAHCTVSKVMFTVVPMKSTQQWSKDLYQSCNSVPCFVSYSKLLWGMWYLKVFSFHLKIFYNALSKKHKKKSHSTVAYTTALYRQVSFNAISFCTISL